MRSAENPDSGISIHALLTESDRCRSERMPLRSDFNPRSPHGERQRSDFLTMTKVQISIHALLTESDLTDEFSSPDGRRFQSTLSSRRATMNIALRTSLPSNFNPRSPHGERRAIWCPTGTPRNFNPRSPHGERPSDHSSPVEVFVNFNPRSPHGERPCTCPVLAVIDLFQSTLSSRRATANTTKLALSFLSKVPI